MIEPQAENDYAYDQYRNFSRPPPGYLHGNWKNYTNFLEMYPEERRHQRIHSGHNCWVLPEEEKFLTEAVLAASSMIGAPNTLRDRIGALEVAGLNQIMILPIIDSKEEVLEDVAHELIPALLSQ